MYYLKLENVEDMGNGALVTVNGMTFMVPKELVTTQVEAASPDMGSLLEHMQRLTSHIEGLSQPPNLSPQRVPEPIPTPVEAPDQEAMTRQERPGLSKSELESLGIRDASPDTPFKVNEEATPRDIVGDAIKLNALYESNPSHRRQVIERVAGMMRLDMLKVKDLLSSELRRAVVGSIMNRDKLQTGVIPPDIAAFADDRPLAETLGSRQWDPGSDQAKDNVSAKWMESQSVMNKIATEVDDSEFAHMYPSTADVASQVKRKFSSATKPE